MEKIFLKNLPDMKEWLTMVIWFFKKVTSGINNLDFFKKFGTLNKLLINLLSKERSTNEAIQEQEEIYKKKRDTKFHFIERRKYFKKLKQKVSSRKQIIKHREIKFLHHKNSIKLYDKRNIIINTFVTKDILSVSVEADLYYTPEDLEPEPLFEESIAKRTKKRRQKSDEENQKGQEIKILTSNQMLSRLPISLAQL